MGFFGTSRRIERLEQKTAELDAKLEVILQLTAIQMADPALYSKVIETVARWKEGPDVALKTGEPGDKQDIGDAMDQLANMMAYAGREQPAATSEREA